MIKSPSPKLLSAIKIAQKVLVLGIFLFASEQVVQYGLFSRGILGIHWLYIDMFLAMLLVYFLRNEVNLLYVIPIGVTYYCVHEALFNFFFIAYNGFQRPYWATTTWYLEIIATFTVTPIFIAICLKKRERFLRSGNWAKISIVFWSMLIALYAIRIAYGFPVSINVYDVFGTNTPSTLANEFEFATNVLFAMTFYSNFKFRSTISTKWSVIDRKIAQDELNPSPR